MNLKFRTMKRRQSGMILIEAILALGITVVIIAGIVSSLIFSLNNSTFSKNQNSAGGYAQEGLEIARNFKDSDYDAFLALATEKTYCLGEGATAINPLLVGECGPNVGVFSRRIYLSGDGNDNRVTPRLSGCSDLESKFVASTVSWTDSKCQEGDDCHKVELSSCFTDLNAIQIP